MRKTRYWLLALVILPLLLTSLPSQNAKAQDVVVSYQTFYDQLAPYGQWIYDPEYGNVWVPYVGAGFRPYASDGHWVLTDEGNMWVSDEPWGWAAYHYGRWTYNPYYGWMWLPGYEWAPAWVTWRYGSGYYGWAPMSPGYEFGRHHHYDYPDNYWVFVNPDYLYHPSVYNYYERGDASIYVRRTDYIRYEDRGSREGYGGGRGYYYGPRREDVERETHRPVDVYRVSNAREAGGGRVGDHEINIYRPAVNRESVNSARPGNVIQGNDHPIGRPAPIAPNHQNVQPTFRQEHPQQQAPPPQYQQHQEQQHQEHQQFQEHQQQQQPPHQEQQHQQYQQQQQPPHQEQQHQQFQERQQQQPPHQEQQPPRQQQYQQEPPRQQPPHQEQQQPPHQQYQQQQPPRQQQQMQQPPRQQQQQPPRPQPQPRPQQQPKPQPKQEIKH